LGKLPYSPRRSSSKSKRIIFGIISGILIYLILGGPYGAVNLIRLRRGKIRAENKILQLKGEKVLLNEEIQGLTSDTFKIEKLAREKLGMIKDGEIIIEIEDSSNTK